MSTNPEVQHRTAADEYYAHQLKTMQDAWATLPETERHALGLLRALNGKMNPAAIQKFVATGTWP